MALPHKKLYAVNKVRASEWSQLLFKHVKFEVITVMTIESTIFSAIILSSSAEVL
jgi:hypothetical protein